ncbi:MAG: phosphatase PAP2 family protein [Leptolyngbya sp. PLA3]|nr:MAG: phosphatase PAP2 family protein [Cyanobacteria bacterium CYA]MCE7967218.1 phosphatase PAP2 family protein [Leptolyngbya sp. PL-A3]
MTGRSDYNPRIVPRIWTVGLLLVALACAVFPFDGAIADAAAWLRQRLSGDAERELEAIQQYGQFGSMVIVSVAFVLLQPWRARRLLDLAAASGLTWVVTIALKMLVGRPRPKFEDPGVILGPWGRYLVSPEGGERHAWEFWGPISSDLWSMPSSHTAFAVMFSVFLGSLAPRLRPLLWVLAGMVGAGRVLFGGHYLSDVLAGAAVGWVCGWLVVRCSGGVRGVDWMWKRTVHRQAPGAYGRLVQAERSHGL